MPDAYADPLIVGEKRPVFGSASAPSGATNGAPSSATFTLYDDAGSVVTGFNAVSITGADPGGTQVVRVWYLLDSTGLTPGVYRGVFKFTSLGSDGISRIFEPSVGITVWAAGGS